MEVDDEQNIISIESDAAVGFVLIPEERLKKSNIPRKSKSAHNNLCVKYVTTVEYKC